MSQPAHGVQCMERRTDKAKRGTMITYEQFKEFHNAIGGSSEPPIFFDEKCEEGYMIIKYNDGPTF